MAQPSGDACEKIFAYEQLARTFTRRVLDTLYGFFTQLWSVLARTQLGAPDLLKDYGGASLKRKDIRAMTLATGKLVGWVPRVPVNAKSPPRRNVRGLEPQAGIGPARAHYESARQPLDRGRVAESGGLEPHTVVPNRLATGGAPTRASLSRAEGVGVEPGP